ncbi:MAG: UspA protein [Actinoallomurus sp.]|nr:UspA protein [Actinoallomurus sp.]
MIADAHRKAEKTAVGLCVRSEIVTGSSSAALVQRSADAGLVVLGTRGRGGLRELLAGSVALQVAGHASCPVSCADGPR